MKTVSSEPLCRLVRVYFYVVIITIIMIIKYNFYTRENSMVA